MDPFSITALVLAGISALIGVTTSVVGAQAAAEAQQRQAEAQAGSLKQQAEQEAQDQVQRSLLARRENLRKLSAAEANYAASGVSLQGTPTLALGQMAEENELEVAMMESSSRSKRNVLLTDAQNILNEAGSSSSVIRTSGYLNAAGSLFGGIGSGIKDGYTFKKLGTLP